MSMKKPMTLTGKPVTFQFVAQHLNHSQKSIIYEFGSNKAER